MTFQEVINKIENKIGESIVRQGWTATLLSITGRRPKSIKVLIRFTEGSFSFERELKLVDQHFDEDSKYSDEIIRQLKRLNDYSKAVIDFSVISDPPNITNKWKAYISEVVIKDPITATLVFTYVKNQSGELMTFTKEYPINAESFISKQFIGDDIDRKLELLNTPIDITYYQNLI